jgi:endonuclease/exonuclease/phosphatase family metal-dependent hydrolase
MRWLVSLLEWINLLLVLITFLCYLAPYISPVTFWPASFVGLSYPWLLLAHVLFILLWALMKKKFIVLSILSLAFGWSHIQTIVGFNSPKQAVSEGQLKIASFNTYGFRDQEDGRRMKEERLLESVDFSSFDVVCLQEAPPMDRGHYVYQFFKNKQGFSYHTPLPMSGMAIFSKYPLKNASVHYFQNRANGYAVADLSIDTFMIRLLNVHLQSNAVSGLANEVAEAGKLQEKETWLNIRGMMAQYKRAAVKRASQAEEINKLLQQSPYPIILCGDFNDIPQSYVYHTMARGLKDGFKEKGRGLGITYAGKIPALRIDYILASPELEFTDYDTGKTNFSDHYPVFSTIRYR